MKRSRLIRALCGSAFLTALCLTATSGRPARADQIEATWNGGTSNWNNGAFWTFNPASGATFPNNNGDTFDVLIDNGNAVDSQVTLNVNVTVDSVTIDNGDTLAILDDRNLTLANSLTNNGTITITDTSSGANGLIFDGVSAYAGNGVIQANNSLNNRIGGVNNAELTLQDGLSLVGTLNIALNGDLNNQGGLDVEAGTLQIQNTDVSNGGAASITSTDNARVQFGGGANIEGGTLTSDATSRFQTVTGDAGSLANLSITAGTRIRINDDDSLTLRGAIQNEGTFEFVDTTSGANDLIIDGAVMMNGVNRFTANNSFNNRVRGVNTADLTLQNGLSLESGRLVFESLDMVTNEGALTVDDATLRLQNTDLANDAGGTVAASNNARIQLNGGANLSGGALTSDATSRFETTTTNAGSLADLTITNGTTVRINDDDSLILRGSIVNQGTFDLVDTTSGSNDLIIDGAVTISGANHFTANNSFNNRVRGVNNADLTLQDGLSLEQGLVVAQDFDALKNNGTIATAAGTDLRFQNAAIDNTGGIIDAGDGRVQLNGGVTITGGILQGGTGRIETTTDNAGSLSDVAISPGATVRINDDDRLTLRGSIVNQGTFDFLETTSGLNQLEIDGAVTISGFNRLTANNSTNNRISGINTPALTLQDGLNQEAGTIVMTNVNNVINNGPIDVSNNAVLRIDGAAINNAGGTIGGTDGGRVQLGPGTTVTGGFLVGASGGRVETAGNASIEDVTLVAGELRINDDDNLTARGTLTNNGTIRIQETTSGLNQLRIDGAVTLEGTGSFSANTSFNNRIFGTVGDALTIDGRLVLTAGLIDVNVPTITNNGTVGAENGARLFFRDADQVTNVSGSTLSGGVWTVSGGARLDLTGAAIDTNDAEIILSGAGSRFDEINGLTSNTTNGILRLIDDRDFNVVGDPTFINDGLIQVLGADTTFSATNLVNSATGTLAGTGVFDADVTSAGTIAPGASAGLLTFTDDLTLNSGSLLDLELGGLDRGVTFDAIDVTGEVGLNGLLQVLLIDGFLPNLGDRFEILTAAGGVIGAFDIDQVVATNNNAVIFDIEITSNAVALVAVSVIPEPSTILLCGTALAGGLAFGWTRRRQRTTRC